MSHVADIFQQLRGVALIVAILASPPAFAQSASVTYAYDDAGRLITATYSDGKVIQYQYDAAGNRYIVTQGQPASLSISDATASEGTSQGSNLTFVVTKTGTYSQDITVSCVTIDGTAQTTQPGQAPYDDYTPINIPLTFVPGSPSGATQNCVVATKPDAFYEGNQTFSVLLQNLGPGAIIADGAGIGTITDDDSSPSFSVAAASQVEGSTLTFSITKAGLTEHPHSITHAAEDGTATVADADYASVGPSSIQFSPTQTTAQVSVQTFQDSKYELAETVGLRLSNATGGATISGTNPAIGTITNDDPAPTFAIDSPAAVAEGAQVTFAVTKSGSTGVTHSLNWATANNTAVAPGDYIAGSGSINFEPSDLTKQIVVQTSTDAVSGEGDEIFFVNLITNAGSNGAVIATSQGIGTIADPGSSIPGVPGNLRTNPEGENYDNDYDVLWDASTGAPSYYTLEESDNLTFSPLIGSYTVNAPTTFRNFFNSAYGERYYRVKACNSSSQCSNWAGPVMILNCPSGVCP